MNLATNPGIASLLIGTGSRTGNDPNLTMATILSNRAGYILNVGSAGCLGGYSPLAGDGRLLSVHVNDPAQSISTTLSPNLNLNAVPMAYEAQRLGGYQASDFILVSAPVTQTNLLTLTNGSNADALHHHDAYVKVGAANQGFSLLSGQTLGLGSFTNSTQPAVNSVPKGTMWINTDSNQITYFNGTSNVGLNNSGTVSASGFTGSLAGDVTGTQGATVVSLVGTVSAANVASGANLANASTSTLATGTVVRRDASGNFSAGTITATLNGMASTASYASTAGYALSAPSSSTASFATTANFALTAAYATSASSAGSAGSATTANFASSASYATIAGSAGTATTASFASSANYATSAGSASTATTSTAFSGSLLGDVTGTQALTVVSMVSGVTAANVAAGASLANAATSTMATGTIVRRDASGSFSVANIASSSNILMGSSVGSLTVTVPATVTSYTITLPASLPGAGQVLTATGPTGLLEWATPAASSSTASTANFATSASYATNAGSAGSAASASYATSANFATTAGSAGVATTANFASTANYAASAGSAGSAGSASTASFASSANYATSAGSANSATTATFATTANSSTSFSGSLAGDVTGNQGSTVVALVSGLSAANVASGASLAIASTSALSTGAIVRRDASGDFSAGIITATLNGGASSATTANYASTAGYAISAPNAGSANYATTAGFATNAGLASTANFSTSATYATSAGSASSATTSNFASSANYATSAGSANSAITANFASTANYATSAGSAGSANSATTATFATTANSSTSFSGALAGDVTGNQGSTVVALVSGLSAANVASGASLAIASTSALVTGSIVRRDASGDFSAGIITATLNGGASSATTANYASTAGYAISAPNAGSANYATTAGFATNAGNATTVTTNANLTGPITSVGNTTSIASFTGTGTTFVMSAGPTFSGSVSFPGGVWDSSNNVGIGTASPASNLQIGSLTVTPTATPITLSLGGTFSPTGGLNPKFKLYDDGTAIYGMGIGPTSLDYIVPASTGAKHAFYIGGVEKAQISQAGNFGVGTTNPSELLDVGDFGNFGGAKVGIGFLASASTNATRVSPRSLVNVGTNLNGSVIISSNLQMDSNTPTPALNTPLTHSTISGAGITIPGNAETRQNYIQFWTTPPTGVTAGAAYAQSSPRMVIDPNGNVGIGTVGPTTTLHVVGVITATSGFSGTFSGTSGSFSSGLTVSGGVITANSGINNNSAGITNAGAVGGITNLVGSTTLSLSTTGSNAMSFATSGTTAMTILPNGNVGIGTTTPTATLDVNGGVRAGSTTSVTACGMGAANGEGTQRYNYTTHQMEYCNGTTWLSATNFINQSCSTGYYLQGFNSSGNPICVDLNTFNSRKFTAVAGGYANFCGLVSDQRVTCWGYNPNGELGTNDYATRLVPNDVLLRNATKLEGITDIAGGLNTTCALRTDGTIYCWGYNGYGGLGNGTTTQYPFAVQVAGITTATKVRVGWQHTCALLSDATVKCWGRGEVGQMGNGSWTATNLTPSTVPGLTGVTELSVGGLSTCAIGTYGGNTGLFCWGYNVYGELGVGDTTNRNVPTRVIYSGLSNPIKVSVGTGNYQGYSYTTTCAINNDNKVWCWGYGYWGQIGNNVIGVSTYHTPVQVLSSVTGTALTGAVSVFAGGHQACIINTSGNVWCWGYNFNGELGINNTTSQPRAVQALGLGGSGVMSNAIQIAHMAYTVSAVAVLDSSGKIYIAGYNADGQHGNFLTNATSTFTLVTPP